MNRLRVMFVGDSITGGTTGSATNYGGYRGQLLGQKLPNGMLMRTVGSNTLSLFGAENKWVGAGGYRIDQINPEAARDSVQWAWDVALLHVGTNDATQRNSGGTPTLATSQANLTTLLNNLRASNPSGRVFFAKICPSRNAAVDALIVAQNSAFETQILARSDASLITIVDIYAAIKANANWTTEWMFDDTHPNDYGYGAVATAWANALTAAGY